MKLCSFEIRPHLGRHRRLGAVTPEGIVDLNFAYAAVTGRYQQADAFVPPSMRRFLEYGSMEMARRVSDERKVHRGANDETILLSTPGTASVGRMVQIEGEVLEVTAVAEDRMQYTVARGAQGTTAAAHGTTVPVFELASKTVVVPFPAEFFGSPYSGRWSYPISLPNVRIASGQLFMTNRKGNGPAACVSLTHSSGNGLRTLRGGQYSIQFNGFLAVDQSAAPALVVEADHSVRDVFAILGTAADSQIEIAVNVNGTPYCRLSFAANTIVSNSVDGATLTPLKANSQVNISILSVGQTCPGADLTVVIRL